MSTLNNCLNTIIIPTHNTTNTMWLCFDFILCDYSYKFILTLQHHKWYKAMVLKLEQVSESSRGLVWPHFPEFLFQHVWGRFWEFLFLTHFQEMLMPLFWKPHFEDYWLEYVMVNIQGLWNQNDLRFSH